MRLWGKKQWLPGDCSEFMYFDYWVVFFVGGGVHTTTCACDILTLHTGLQGDCTGCLV